MNAPAKTYEALNLDKLDIPEDYDAWKAYTEEAWKSVTHNGHWKGRCVAVVPNDQVEKVAYAMASCGAVPDAIIPCEPFRGAAFPDITLTHVDGKTVIRVPTKEGHTAIHSQGYWHHIGA